MFYGEARNNEENGGKILFGLVRISFAIKSSHRRDNGSMKGAISQTIARGVNRLSSLFCASLFSKKASKFSREKEEEEEEDALRISLDSLICG